MVAWASFSMFIDFFFAIAAVFRSNQASVMKRMHLADAQSFRACILQLVLLRTEVLVKSDGSNHTC